MYSFEDVQNLLGGQFAIQYYTENRIYYVMHILNNDIEEAKEYKKKLETEEKDLLERFNVTNP